MVTKVQAQECVAVCKWLKSLNDDSNIRRTVTLTEVIVRAEKALRKGES